MNSRRPLPAYMAVGLAMTFLSFSATSFSADTPIAGTNLNTPDSPASSIVGGSTQGLVRPGNPAEFGVDVLNALGQNGNLNSGVAVEASPAMLLMHTVGRLLTQPEYRSNAWLRFLWRISLSVATAKGQSSYNQARAVGSGLRFTLFDVGDPIEDLALDGCQTDAQSRAWLVADQATKGQEIIPGKAFPSQDIHDSVADTLNKKCQKDAALRNWNRSAWSVSGANAWISQNGKPKQLTQQGYQINTTLAYGFDGFHAISDEDLAKNVWAQKLQLVTGLQYANKQVVPDPVTNGVFHVQNSMLYGTQVRFRPVTDPKILDAHSQGFSFVNTILSLEVAYIVARPDTTAPTRDLTVTAGFEFKIVDGMYFDLGIGKDKKTTGGTSKGFGAAQFKYNFGGSSSLFAGP